jgi:hypothetical protein
VLFNAPACSWFINSVISSVAFCVYFLGADTFNQSSLNISLISLFEKFIAAIFTSLSAQGLNKTWVVAR